MLKIRLKKIGRKKEVCYKVVIMNALSKRDGKSLDLLGHYSPSKKEVFINKSKLLKYVSNGAQPSQAVNRLIWKNLINKV